MMAVAVMLAVIGAVACLLTQRWWAAGLPPGNARSRLAVVLLVGLAIASCWVSVVERSGDTWNSVRTILPVAMAKGLPVYNTSGNGPMWCSIYPPVGLALYTPTALSHTPAGAIAIGQWLSVLWVAGTAAVLGWRAGRLHGIGNVGAIAGACTMLAAAAALSPICDATFMVHVDAPAIGLALLACGLLMNPGDTRATWRLALAGTLAGLAVMSKQTMLPLVFVLSGWIWLGTDERRWKTTALFVLPCLATITLTVALASAAYGWSAFLFSVFRLPSSHKLQLDVVNFWELVRSTLKWILAPALLAGIAVRLSTRSAGGKWTNNPATLLVLVGLAQIPLAVMAFVKIGGERNNFAYFLTFWIAAIIVTLVRFLAVPPARGTRAFVATCLSLAIAACLWNLLTIRSSPAWGKPNQHHLAYRLIQRSPGQYYFYWLPLSHLLAEGRQTHQSWGIMDHHLAGQSPTAEWLWSYIPQDALFICATDRPIAADAGLAAIKSEFPTPVTLRDLPGWYCFARATAQPKPQQPPPP